MAIHVSAWRWKWTVACSSRRVTRVLEWIIGQRGAPETLRFDDGPEFTSRHFLVWCEERKIRLVHIEPGRPMQNGRGELQREAALRVLECQLVSVHWAGETENRELEGGI